MCKKKVERSNTYESRVAVVMPACVEPKMRKVTNILLGMSAFPYNKAGAAYGTGYCDAQCPQVKTTKDNIYKI